MQKCSKRSVDLSNDMFIWVYAGRMPVQCVHSLGVCHPFLMFHFSIYWNHCLPPYNGVLNMFTKCMSLGMIVTHLACIVARLLSCKYPIKYISVASLRAITADDCHLKPALQSCPISRKNVKMAPLE